MPLLQSFALSDDQPGFGVWRIEESLEELERSVALEGEERGHFVKRKTELHQKQFLVARLLIAQALGEYQPIRYLPTGQPYFASSRVNLSISHSDLFVAVALSNSGGVGIDVEVYPRASLRKAKGYFLSDPELDWVGESPDILLLHVLWSAKEAVFKQGANSEVNFKNDIYIRPFNVSRSGICVAQVGGEVLNVMYWMTDEYVCAIACETAMAALTSNS